MQSRRTWRWSAALAAATLVLGGISAGWAADLGGTTWSLGGSRSLTVTKLKAQRDKIEAGHGVLTFNGVSADPSGTCRLDISDSSGAPVTSYGCNWTTVANKPAFTILLDQAAVQADLQARADSYFPGSVVTATFDTGKGAVNKRSGRMSVRMQVKGTLQVSGEKRARNWNLVLVGSGTKTN